MLAEANPSRPSLAVRFGVIDAPDTVHRVGASSLGVMARPAAVEDAGLLRERLGVWQSDWDLVVLDAVPLLESGMGGLVAAAAADATVLVVRAGHVAAMQLRAARERLGRVDANLLGVVMNDRDDPSLLSELERETHRLGRFMPGLAKALRKRLARAPLLALRV